jgi:hypothetical protein
MRSWSVLIAVCLPLGACAPGGTPFLRDCEKAIGERLLAPSTYKRVSSAESAEVLPIEAWRALADPKVNAPEAEVLLNVEGGKPPKGLMARVQYDASNGLGVPIRTLATCTFLADAGSYDPQWAWAIEVDGKTNLEWKVTDGLQR